MTDYLEFENEIKEYKEQVRTARQHLADKVGANLVKAANVILFDKYPFATGIGWTQYTPHFNDGDPCEFSTYTDEPDFFSLYLYSKTHHMGEDEFLKDLGDAGFCKSWNSGQEEDDEIQMEVDYQEPEGEMREEFVGLREAAYDLAKFLNDIVDEDVFRTAFDEGYIKLTREGIETMYYERH